MTYNTDLTPSQQATLDDLFKNPRKMVLTPDILELIKLHLVHVFNRPKDLFIGQFYDLVLSPRGARLITPELNGSVILENHARGLAGRPRNLRLRDDNDRVWWFEETDKGWTVMFCDYKGDGHFQTFTNARSAHECLLIQKAEERKRQKKIREINLDLLIKGKGVTYK